MGLPAPIQAKLDWADAQYEAFMVESAAYGERQPYRSVSERSADGKTHAFGVVFDEPVPSERWGLMLSDALHHWRSALDHLVFAIAVKEEGGTLFPKNAKGLMFPVDRPDGAGWENLKKRVRTLPTKVRTAIKREQSGKDHKALFLLDRLQGMDKHRTVTVFSATVEKPMLVLDKVPAGTNHIQVLAGKVDGSAPLAILTTERPTFDMKVKEFTYTLRLCIELHDPKNFFDGRAYLPIDDFHDMCRPALTRIITRIARAGGIYES